MKQDPNQRRIIELPDGRKLSLTYAEFMKAAKQFVEIVKTEAIRERAAQDK